MVYRTATLVSWKLALMKLLIDSSKAHQLDDDDLIFSPISKLDSHFATF